MLVGRRLVGACLLVSVVVADTQQHDCSAVRVQLLKEQQEIAGKLQSRLDECTTISGRHESEKNGLVGRASALEQRALQLENELKSAVAKYTTELKTRDDMLASLEGAQKAGEELSVTRAKLADAMKEVETSRSELERSRAEVRTLMETNNAIKAEADRVRAAEVERVRAEVEKAGRAEIERAQGEVERARLEVKNAKSEVESARSEGRKEAEMNWKNEMDRMRAQFGEKVAKLEHELSEVRRQRSTMESELSKRRMSDAVIFSEAEFKKHAEDAKRVGKAFLGVLHQKLVRLIGEEAHDLAVLQTRVWYESVSKGVKKGAVSCEGWVRQSWVWRKVKSHKLYHEGVQHFKEGMASMQKTVGSILTFVEDRMERIITNMSAIDPSVRQLFPTNFIDRCFAFAYCFILAYLLRSLISYLLSFIVFFHIGGGRGGPKSRGDASSKKTKDLGRTAQKKKAPKLKTDPPSDLNKTPRK